MKLEEVILDAVFPAFSPRKLEEMILDALYPALYPRKLEFEILDALYPAFSPRNIASVASEPTPVPGSPVENRLEVFSIVIGDEPPPVISTEQFVSPGAQSGSSVSPGVYCVIRGAA
jgi:hypothetical protein